MKQIFYFLTGWILCVAGLSAQNVAIGQWKAHLAYNGAMSVVDAGELVYCANESSLFTFNKTDNSYQRLSTATGFSDIGVKGIYYDELKNTLVIAYVNSNIDLVLDGEIYNFPAIKSGNVSGDKNIYGAGFKGDTIILSCGFGIVLFDIAKRESPATYYFNDITGANFRVNSTTVFQGYIYAATAKGIYRGNLNYPLLEDFGAWEKISGTEALPDGDTKFITSLNDELYAAVGDTIYASTAGDWNVFLSDENWHVSHLYAVNNHLLITEKHGDIIPSDSSRIYVIDETGAVTIIESSTQLSYPIQSVIDKDNNVWIADSYNGLVKTDGTNYTYYLPNGPASVKVIDIAISNSIVWVAPGEITPQWTYAYNRDGFFIYDFGYWTTVNNNSLPALDTLLDIFAIEIDEQTNTTYLASYGGGLLEYHRDGQPAKVYKQGYVEGTVGDESKYRVSGLKLDQYNNLWITNYGAQDPIVVKKSDGTWKTFTGFSIDATGNQVGQVVIDDYNQKWVQMPRGNGILVLNDNNTIDDESDDKVKVLSSGAGKGNLHTNYINCLAADKQGEIWVGTNEGITIFYNPSEVFSGTTAGDATQPLVNLGGYYEQLLRNDIVNTIAVDGANRKWVGTNSGAFLINEDGTEQLYYFNQDNSPLFSNTVLTIEIDDITGDVYFGTDKGIISFRFTATEGVEEITEVNVFPNPVREDYEGVIAINGLTRDAEIRITDISGRMIFQTTALGGQAIWDGKGYNGERAKTGVYLVYSSNDDGSQTYVAKILMIN